MLVGMLYCRSLPAMVIVDFSPETTGAPVGAANVLNVFGGTIIGDRFTLPNDVTLTGGAIFSGSGIGMVGQSVRFMVFADSSGIPGGVAVIDITTLLDAVDFELSGTSGLTRKHATIDPTFLAAGNYWFAMPGATLNVAQGVTPPDEGYADGHFALGATSLSSTGGNGDMFFALEDSTSVPEPSTLLILGLAFAAMGLFMKKRVYA